MQYLFKAWFHFVLFQKEEEEEIKKEEKGLSFVINCFLSKVKNNFIFSTIIIIIITTTNTNNKKIYSILFAGISSYII